MLDQHTTTTDKMLLLAILTVIPHFVYSRYSVYGHEGQELQADSFGEYYPPYHEMGYGGSYGGSHDEGYMSDWGKSQWPSIHGNPPKCIDIPSNLTLCHGIGYDQMRLPNLLEHDSLSEVTRQAASWVNLMRINCHPDTRLFLCSLFSPVCLDRPIYPCRKLCQSVKAGCESRMLKYGFPWPEMLKCDQFPLDNDLCISPQNENKDDSSICTACNQPNTFEALVDNFCRADIVLRVKIKREIDVNGEKKLSIGKKKRVYKKGGVRKRDLENIELFIEDSQKCDCGLPTEGHEKDYYFAMLKKQGNRFYAQAMHIYDKNNRDMKKALRAIRKKDNICEKKGLEFLAINDDPFAKGKRKKSKKSKNNGSDGSEQQMTTIDQTTKAYIASTTAKIIAPSKRSRNGRRGRNRDRNSERRNRQIS